MKHFVLATTLFLNIIGGFSMPRDAVKVWHKPNQDSLINGNPVEKQHSVADTIDIEAEDFCLFSVHDAGRGVKEKPVWRMTKGSGMQIVCTTDRMADLDEISYMNYSRNSAFPRIYSYRYKMPKDSSKRVRNIIIGGNLEREIPIDTVLGMQGEYIVTSRILNPKEMGIIESYLSIKYGVSLDKMKSYYSASGDIIWSAKKNSGYNGNVFGLGRDSLSGLSQKKSRNVVDSSLTVSSAALKNGEYILFGDNGGNPEYVSADDAGVLAREWLVRHNVKGDTLHCDLDFAIKPQYSSVLRVTHKDGTQKYINPQHGQIFRNVTLRDEDRITLVTEDDIESDRTFIAISATPNPVRQGESCTIAISTESSAKFELRMYDDEGRVLVNRNGFTEGLEYISLLMNTPGVFIVEAEARGVKVQSKIIVEQ